MRYSMLSAKNNYELVRSLNTVAILGWEAVSMTMDPLTGCPTVLVGNPTGRVGTLGCTLGDPKTYPFPLPKDEQPLVMSLTEDWGAGDGVMQAGARLVIRPDGGARFDSKVKTKFTHSKDVWHQSFVVELSSGGSPIVWSVNSEEMSEQDNPIWHDFHADFRLPDPRMYWAVSKVTWVGCC